MTMRLWVLRPKGDDQPAWDPWYDKVFGFVIRATSELAARTLADMGGGPENSEQLGNRPWLDPAQSTCLELKSEGLEQMIMSDVHWA